MVLNDPPYGSERTYTGLRLASNLLRQDEELGIDLVLVGDAVSCAKGGQQVPDGCYDVEGLLEPVLGRGRVLV
jgi:uncharacterized protein involved in oxidation of intracellular sulfur